LHFLYVKEKIYIIIIKKIIMRLNVATNRDGSGVKCQIIVNYCVASWT
jgi:hypothetical protein